MEFTHETLAEVESLKPQKTVSKHTEPFSEEAI